MRLIDIIEKISSESGLQKKQVRNVINAYVDILLDELKQTNKTTIHKLGKLSISKYTKKNHYDINKEKIVGELDVCRTSFKKSRILSRRIGC